MSRPFHELGDTLWDQRDTRDTGWHTSAPNNTPETPSNELSHGLVDAFANSHSWNFTRRIAPFLEKIPSVTDDYLDLMEKAATENVDVKECEARRRIMGPQWVAQYVSKRRGPTSPATWDSDEPPF